MPKIKSLPNLLKLLAVLFISFLGIHGFITIPNREGVVAVVAPTLAEQIYTIFGNALVIISYLILASIIILIPIAIWSYFHNRAKPDEPSIELKTLTRLESKLDSLIEIMGGENNEAKNRNTDL